jgi:hypothetical protein
MNYALSIGKFLDQPILVSKFSKAVPALLLSGGAALGLYNVYKAPAEDNKKVFIKNLCILGFTIGSALIATRGIKPLTIFGKKIFKGVNGLINVPGVEVVKKSQHKLIEEFLRKNQVHPEAGKILEKAKSKILTLKEIRQLYSKVGSNKKGIELLRKLIPDPQNVKAADIFVEIRRLSLLGIIPVVGGILGGITGDVLTEKTWGKKLADVPNKIKEGFYQYFANIFLCNIGAASALAIMEKMGIQSKTYRAAGMIGGIMVTGVIGGSFIANYMAKKFLNPIFDGKNHHHSGRLKDIYSERKPEALDIGLHLDDIATVAVMSGLRWIEPALPIMYSISGYRAGIGYRNGPEHKKQYQHRHKNNNASPAPAIKMVAGPKESFFKPHWANNPPDYSVYKPFEEFIKHGNHRHKEANNVFKQQTFIRAEQRFKS